MDIVSKLKLALANSGLQEDEIAFYISVLKKPGGSIYEIAKRSKLPKDRAYKIFHQLKEKKLIKVSEADKLDPGHKPTPQIRKHKQIEATSLDNFTESLYSKGRKFYQTADSLKEVKPFLKYLNLPEEETSIKTFGPEHSGEHWIDLSYTNWETVVAYGNFEMMYEGFGAAPDQVFKNRRVKRGKKAFPVLTNPGPYTWDMIVKKDNRELRDTKLLKTDKLNETFVAIFPDKDTISVWLKNEKGQLKGATIKNPLLRKLHEDLFQHFDEIADMQADMKATPTPNPTSKTQKSDSLSNFFEN